ncbi:hypothetical protein UFOVP785_68 [uncultured Caudovirales phage]|uniref:Uncharacterized protein n=1 Tax=uncultured Caudovirales phage TaxID=2100421 RepID=A0A6J5NZS2_9CAUD|nr:hypothetical protein UFOVP785_68 [uncultured Caudovirales phage]
MTAKELRQAAERTLNYDESSDTDIDTLAQYILSTVHDDNDELVTYEWICSTKKPYMENRKIWWNFDGYTVSTSSSSARFHCNHMPIASVKTRGQFRSLCKGLGIVLEERT